MEHNGSTFEAIYGILLERYNLFPSNNIWLTIPIYIVRGDVCGVTRHTIMHGVTKDSYVCQL